MSHSVVKVTENQANDSLILVVGEDGTITPDKETVQSYLKGRTGATELQVMHVNKIDGQNIDVTLDTLMYVHTEEVMEREPEDMDEIARNLLSFRMDHDYTPLTSPKRQSPTPTTELYDELAQTLRILEGTDTDAPVIPKASKVVRPAPKQTKRSSAVKQKARMISVAPVAPPKVIKTLPVKTSAPRPKVVMPEPESDEIEEGDSDFDIEFEDEDSDSDFELEEVPRQRPKRTTPRTRTRSVAESTPKASKTKGSVKALTDTPKSEPAKVETPPKSEILPEVQVKPPEKKPPPKKEKKVLKPPEDFALFSTPDIIRRVGSKGEKEPGTPTTPTSATLEAPKLVKPANIAQENRSRSASSESRSKRVSTDSKLSQPEENINHASTSAEEKHRDRKNSTDTSKDKKVEGHVSVQGYDESVGSNSSESLIDSQLDPLPSAEDIRAIIQNENTKSFTTSLIIPDASELEQNDQNHINLDSTSLDLDQSILDNINTDLIPEDILYQVAQSLVDNPELQNVIDKSIVDGNLMLDPTLQQAITQGQQSIVSHGEANNVQLMNMQEPLNISPIRGTQIVRPDGRVVVIPPIERPTTRSRNRQHENLENVGQVSSVRPVKPLDEEHVSGNELDSSGDNETDEDESEDDPNKLWCICNQPHNNRFMICCDTCEEWYHGKCVNVTKAMGQMMEQDGKEWICLYCKDPLLKRPSAAARRIRKASRTSTDSAGSQRKSSTASLTETAIPNTPACIVCAKPSRHSSIYCSDSCILKHAQGVEKVVVFERKTGRILSGSSAPNAANLDTWLQAHPGFEVVRSTSKPTAVKKMAQSKLQLVKNTSNDGVSLAVQRKGVNIGVLPHAPKATQQVNQQRDGYTRDSFPKEAQARLQKKITSLKIISKPVTQNQPKTKLIQPVPITKPQPPAATTPAKPKPAQPQTPTTPSTSREKPIPQKTPKSRQAEVGAQPQPKHENVVRENVRKTLMEQLKNRIKMVDDLKLTDTQVANISTEIETQLFKCFGDTGQKYRNKYRSLIFNIKDVKNQTLWRRICEKSVNPYQLVRLSPDDLASQELALWREREAKHQLDMIKKSELELLNCSRQYVFKTHKGEQVFEDNRPTDQNVTEVITGLGADSTSTDKEDSKRDGSMKDGERKPSKHKKDRNRDKERKSSKEKGESKEKRRERRSSSRDRDKDRDRDRRKRSRSREHKRSDKKRSRSRDRDRHRRALHKSSRLKKDVHSTTDKLDKKSKEILEQLVDKQIVPPLEDRLWKHVPQEDIVPAPNIESDSDHEPSSTVTIPTPPRNTDSDDVQTNQIVPEVVDSNVSKPDVFKKAVARTVSVDSNEPLSPKDDSGESSPAPSRTREHVWKGTINMVDVAQISITAHEISGDCSGLSVELPGSLDIVGRISPDTVWDYIGKMRCSNSKMISLLRLNATNMEEKMPYIALYSYLSSRNRLGVVKSTNKAVKDFYILPLASQKPIPQALLPISGPGFEESRPPLLLGIIVRDKRKRPLLDSILSVTPKRVKVEIATAVATPTAPATPPMPSTPSSAPRSYTPPPNRDPRIKLPYVPPPVSLPTPATLPAPTPLPIPTPTPLPSPAASLPTPPAPPVDDMDEPYSPEDSDPDTSTSPPPLQDLPKLTTSSLSSIITAPIKTSSFLDTGLTAQAFKPFSNKFATIPGLEDTNSFPASSLELQRKMAELDQRIAMQKAEIDNMSHDIVSSASADIGTTALANIALPSNLQQILDSIKTIGAATSDTSEPQVNKNPLQGAQTDLTIPLMLPKISSRTLNSVVSSSQKHEIPSPTIPLNLPKIKSKHSATNSPLRLSDTEKSSSSVLSSLSEEDLIRKAAEMLGETGSPANKKSKDTPPLPYTPQYVSGSVMYTPPLMIPPPPLLPTQVHTPPKRFKIDLNQPPIPGLED